VPLVNIGGNTKKMDADLKAPVIIVLGKVEAGKTKLSKKSCTSVQQCEARGITQQIGVTRVSKKAILEQSECHLIANPEFTTSRKNAR